jgi:hypothetical protein
VRTYLNVWLWRIGVENAKAAWDEVICKLITDLSMEVSTSDTFRYNDNMPNEYRYAEWKNAEQKNAENRNTERKYFENIDISKECIYVRLG